MKKILFLIIASLGVVSCSDYLDVNHNPNAAESSTPALTLPAAIASVGAQLDTWYNIAGGMWVQYWTQNNGSNQYKGFDAYDIQQATLNVQFDEMYSGALNDFKFVIDHAAAQEDWNLYLMGTVMQCYTFQMLADMYDRIPFDEALQGATVLHPNYRDGQQVYDSLITRLDNAMSKDFGAITNTDPGLSDVLFHGNVNQWIRFANTLKLKIYLREIYARKTVAEAGIQDLYNSGAEFLTVSAAMTSFADTESKSNPLFESDQRKLNTKENIRASKTFIDYLQDNGDPRIDALFIPGSGGQKGLEQGNYGVPTTVVDPSTISRALIQPTDPVYFISAAESYFFQAEAVARGLGAGDDQALYESGVNAAFVQLGLTAGQASALYGAGQPYEYPNSTMAANLEAIAMQKWVALAGSEGMEAFFERNRTGFPAHTNLTYASPSYQLGTLVYPVGGTSGTGNFPMRLLFTQNERARNPNVPEQVPFTTRVWWDVSND